MNFRAARRFSSGLAEELFGGGMPCGKESGSKAMAPLGEGIAVGLLDFADQAVGAEQTDLTAALGGDLARGLVGRIAADGMEEPLEVAVSEARGGEFAARNGPEEGDVGTVADSQGACTMAGSCNGTRDLVEDGGQGSRVIDGRERHQVVVVGVLRDMGASMEIGDALAKWLPGEFAVGLVVVDGTQDFERGGLGDGGFDAQDGAGLV